MKKLNLISLGNEELKKSEMVSVKGGEADARCWNSWTLMNQVGGYAEEQRWNTAWRIFDAMNKK